MSTYSQVVFGAFDHIKDAERAIEELRHANFRNTDISIVAPHHDIPHGTYNFHKETRAPEIAAVGTGFGAFVGGAIGWLAGVGIITVMPGLGPLIAAGPMVTALTGAGVGGAIGGISGALIGIGIPEYEAEKFSDIVKEGGVLVSVHADDSMWADDAKKILEDSGAHHITTTPEKGDGYPRSQSTDHRLNI